MEAFGIDEANIVILLQSVLQKEGISDGKVTIEGTSGVGDGYTGLVIYADGIGKKKGNDILLNFVVKHSTKNSKQREQVPIHVLYQLESHVYQIILPAYQDHLKECNLPPLDCLAKWYGSEIKDNYEIIIFENLKSKGYAVNDIKKRLTLEHTKLILQEYARWHSLGFSLRDKNPDKFKRITTKVVELRAKISDGMNQFMEKIRKIFIDTLKSHGEFELMEKIEKNSIDEITEIVNRNDKYSTILHGDCWNNNFLFRSKKHTEIPEKVAIIDWQVVSVGNPVADISYNIFASISPENFDKIDDLLEHYYSQFSNFLEKLGSDPNKLYPKAKFLKNWKDYAKYSTIFAPVTYIVAQRDASDIPDIDEVENVTDMFTPTDDEMVNAKIIEYARYMSDKGLI